MKPFNKLTVGDIFFKVFTNYEGDPNPKVIQIIASRIELNERDGVTSLIINQRSTYSNSDFEGLLTECESDVVKNGDKGYYTTNSKSLKRLLSEAAISYIKNHEGKIKEEQKAIEKIRIAYWDYLKTE